MLEKRLMGAMNNLFERQLEVLVGIIIPYVFPKVVHGNKVCKANLMVQGTVFEEMDRDIWRL